MKAVGLTGPPGCGKSTLYRAMTGGRSSGEIAAVALQDTRLDTLAELHSSRKVTPVFLNVVDVHAAERTVAAAVARLRAMDALIVVLPAFGGQDGQAALRTTAEDLIVADMAPIETRLQKARKDPALKTEVETLQSALAHLEEGRFLRERDWKERDLLCMSSIAPLTIKPMVAVWNVDESRVSDPVPESPIPSVSACVSLEEEATTLDPESAQEILAGYGVSQPIAQRVVRAVFAELDLITFFVAGQKESRALELKREATAFDAAGQLHTDMQRGFIRAEVVPFDKVVEAGTWDKAKAAGAARVEGRDYAVSDGDVITFRFSV